MLQNHWLSGNAKVNEWGWLPELSLVGSFGLLLVACAYTGSRAAAGWAESAFWSGLCLLIAPITFRLATAEALRQERIALVVLLGLAFYLVKVMQNPHAFTFPDEFSHLRNVVELLQSRHLFQENPVLPVSSLYPGLQTVTGTLVWSSDLPIYVAGSLAIGAARFVLFLSLYLLYEQLTGSARGAGIATVLYMANSNFLFWTAQYAYESLALPLVIMILYVQARQHDAGLGHRRGALNLIALLAVLTVVITHHMTSYLLLGLLSATSGFSLLCSKGKKYGPWALALVALVATVAWLVFVASLTIDYLTPVLTDAIKSVFRMIMREETGRRLFTSAATGYVAPLWERWTAIGAVILIVIGLPFGVVQVWRQHRDKALALALAAGALAYIPMPALRLTSAGWEMSNRASEFLFIGIAFVLAVAVDNWLAGRHRFYHVVLAACIVVVFFGGIIAGWPPKARLPRPYVIAAGDYLIEPQGVSAARWMLAFLGPDNRVAVDASNAKLIGAYGEQHPFTRRKYGIQGMFFSDNVGRTERTIIQKTEVQYVLVDRRLVSWDHVIGHYFNHENQNAHRELELFEPETYRKFDFQEKVNKIYDSGNVFIYDVGVYSEVSTR